MIEVSERAPFAELQRQRSAAFCRRHTREIEAAEAAASTRQHYFRGRPTTNRRRLYAINPEVETATRQIGKAAEEA